MLETSRLWWTLSKHRRWLWAALLAGACAAPPPQVEPSAKAVPDAAAEAAARAAERARLEAEAKAMLAQAETDVQRARAKRALWLKAWEDLLAARKAVEQSEYAQAIARARSASELAELGLEQLAYPAVK